MSEDHITCPFCAEPILADAIKCKHCGSFLAQRVWNRQDWAWATVISVLVILLVTLLSLNLLSRRHWQDAKKFAAEANFDHALSEVNKAKEICGMVCLHLISGFDKARLCLQSADLLKRLGKKDAALQAYREATQLAPNNSLYQREYIDYAESTGQDLEALLVAYQKTDKHNIAAIYFTIGYLNYKLKIYDKAIHYFDKAIELDQTDAEPHFGLGLVYQHQNQEGWATTQFKKAIELAPTDALPYIALGDIYSDELKEEAMVEYKKAIEIDPSLAAPHFILGKLYSDSNNCEDAIVEYKIAAELDPINASQHYELGEIFKTLEKYDEAIYEYNKAAELDPKGITYYLNIGDIEEYHERYVEALDAYRKAVRIESKLSYPHERLGDFYQNQNRFDEAIAEYRKANELYLNDEIEIKIGNIYLVQKKYDEAIAKYEKAVFIRQSRYGLIKENPVICDDKEALLHLEEALLHLFDDQEALSHLGHDIVHDILGNVYKEQEKYATAIDEYERGYIKYSYLLFPEYKTCDRYEFDIRLSTPLKFGLVDIISDLSDIGFSRTDNIAKPEIEATNGHVTCKSSEGKRLVSSIPIYDKAVDAAKNAVELDPNAAWVHRKLGGEYLNENKVDEAIVEYTRPSKLLTQT